MPGVLTTCPYCGCGCGLYLKVNGRGVVGTSASAGHPVARGGLCARGWHAHEIVTSSLRLTSPLVRRGGALEEVGWGEALDAVAGRLYQIKATAGVRAVGALGSPRATNEESFLLSKLARVGFGTNNVDFSARCEALPQLYDLPQYRHLTVSSAGLGAIEEADLILLWQSDPAEEHTAVASRVMRAAERGVPIIEVKTRSGQLGGVAALRLQPFPGSEAQLAGGLLQAALGQGESGRDEGLAAAVDACTPERTQQVCGVPAEAVLAAGEMLAAARRPLVVYGRGATLSPDGAELLMALAALNRVAQSEEGWFHLLWLNSTCNFQGARDMGVVPYFLPGYQAVSDPHARERFQEVWGAPIPTEAGLPAWEMLGKVRGLFVMGDDPISSSPRPGDARKALSGLDFLVVQDIVMTPTAELADVVLPGASFAEKDGTFTSTERRVQRVRKAVDPPGAARADWEILSGLAERLGGNAGYGAPSEIMDEIRSVAPIYGDMSYDRLERGWGQIGAMDGEVAPARAVLGEEGSHDPALGGEAATPRVDEEFPVILSADYTISPWSTDTLVVSSLGLRRQQAADRPATAPRVEISPADAQALDVRSGQRVRIVSRDGQADAVAAVREGVRQGVAVMMAGDREAVSGVVRLGGARESGAPMLWPTAVRIEKTR